MHYSHSNNVVTWQSLRLSPCLSLSVSFLLVSSLSLFPLNEDISRERLGTSYKPLATNTLFPDLLIPPGRGTDGHRDADFHQHWVGQGERVLLSGNRSVCKLSISDECIHPGQEGEIKNALLNKCSLRPSETYLLAQKIPEPRVRILLTAHQMAETSSGLLICAFWVQVESC